ncbi:hypothetical protein [Antarctobacter sp.]|uniref:hypothetical protein n=1 Tax=Antarctobacter sp. TaxID=1872577 RepID=UPI002B27073A|nr:hypothetical protein [Antarctobacter sp.]
MSKEKSRGNRETKKPKKEKVKVLATANNNIGKEPVIAGKAIGNKLSGKPAGKPSGKPGGKAPHAA